ncbi:MAG: DUF4159 domain-containing protein [Alphaproteobacteria bacterium]
MSSLAFGAPWVLAALVLLPVIWWLLRVLPPAPKLVRFPPVRLLFGLSGKEETPAKTQPWLIALRLALAALLIVGLAEPLLNPETGLDGDGPLILVVDDGWAAARRWQRRQTAMTNILERAARDDRSVVLLTTAPSGSQGAADTGRLMRADEVLTLTHALEPKPWAVDRAAAAMALDGLRVEGNVDVVWLSDGIHSPSATVFAKRLAGLGNLQVMLDDALDRAHVLLLPEPGPGVLNVKVLRPSARAEETVWLRVSDEDGAVLARMAATFSDGEQTAVVELDVPTELRNRMARMNIEGERGANAVVLFDERWRRRPVGLVSVAGIDADQPLLSEIFYLERALEPISEVRKGEIADLLARPLAVLVLADVKTVVGNDRLLVENWINGGGVLLRFAGPRIAEGADDLVPVHLRLGGRTFGGALSWEKPARLAPFADHTPFAGLTIPDDVHIRRQVLAEPSLDLAAKTWARLVDGTPLVTAERWGEGWLVLVHTTASTAWSDLAISGLFVEMLYRLVQLSQGITGDLEDGALAPLQTLDGFGRLGAPTEDSRPVAAREFGDVTPGPRHPPGYYGAQGARQVLNLTAGFTTIKAIDNLPATATRRDFGEAGEADLKPWFLIAALMLAFVDLIAGMVLRGLVPGRAVRAAAGVALMAIMATPALAQEATTGDDDFILAATLESRFGYIITGDSEIDGVSRDGLFGLGIVLTARTSIEPATPMAIDVERDELIFFPMIYWPIAASQAALSPAAAVKVNHYLKTGGILLFDTRDYNIGATSLSGGLSPAARRLRTLLRGLDIPPLIQVPEDHILTKAFYLMRDFPGRWTGGQVWVERHEGGVNDGVSSLIIGSHDWAAAWALDQGRRPMFAVVPGGERQREAAFRFGINLAMYAMTGNYKADQVHMPAILERLGQ